MTVAVVWFNERFREVWCAADSRLSKGSGVLMDGGAKIFQVPVICRKEVSELNWEIVGSYSFGFAFSGSSTAALSTHAIVISMTQNFVERRGEAAGISLENVANIFKFVGERQIREMGGRLGAAEHQAVCLFDCIVFGKCPKRESLLAYHIKTSITEALTFELVEHEVHPGFCLSIGSGADEFYALRGDGAGKRAPLTVLDEMVGKSVRTDVGGFMQAGIVTEHGFRVCPIINEVDGGELTASFLGIETDSVPIKGFDIGYRGVGK